jgi:putative endonuclease
MPKIYYVYILASQRRVLYVGMTSNIEHRVFQHKTHAFPGFTAKYNVTNLVYFERYGSVMSAIRQEKELKAWRREEKIKLIESSNPKWRDRATDGTSATSFNRTQSNPSECNSRIKRDVILRRAIALRGDRTKRVKQQCSSRDRKRCMQREHSHPQNRSFPPSYGPSSAFAPFRMTGSKHPHDKITTPA